MSFALTAIEELNICEESSPSKFKEANWVFSSLIMSQEVRLEAGTTGQFRNHGNYSLSQNLQNSEVKLKKFCKCIMFKVFDRRERLGNWTFFTLCLLAVDTHSIFYPIPEINDHKKCIQLNKVKGIRAIVHRSLNDFFYLIYSIFQLSVDLDKNATKSWLLFLVDLFVILPVPQALVNSHPKIFLFAFPFLLVQLVPRVIRMSPRLRLTKTKNIWRHLGGPILAFVSFVYYYVIAGGVIGVLWYFLAIKKMTACWKKAFINRKEYASFYCDDRSSRDYTFLDGLCPMKTPNETIYDFGIYSEALQSGVLLEASSWKRTYCLRWGLQSLSSFGQGLQPSAGVGENIFVLLITICGVLLLIISIGFVQMIVQNQITGWAKMVSKKREIQQWLKQCQILGKLSGDLQHQIKKYLLDNEVQMTKGVDVENLFNYLSDDLKRDIKHELCLPLLEKVEEFGVLREVLLEELCDYVKPVAYTAHTHIVHTGDPIYKMFFVLQGELWTYATNIEAIAHPDFLENGDFCGDELLDWIQKSPSSFNLPISNRAIVARKNVEAFALMAYDLKIVFAKNMSPEERTQPA